jgi:hypothetical protein
MPKKKMWKGYGGACVKSKHNTSGKGKVSDGDIPKSGEEAGSVRDWKGKGGVNISWKGQDNSLGDL